MLVLNQQTSLGEGHLGLPAGATTKVLPLPDLLLRLCEAVHEGTTWQVVENSGFKLGDFWWSVKI